MARFILEFAGSFPSLSLFGDKVKYSNTIYTSLLLYTDTCIRTSGTLGLHHSSRVFQSGSVY